MQGPPIQRQVEAPAWVDETWSSRTPENCLRSTSKRDRRLGVRDPGELQRASVGLVGLLGCDVGEAAPTGDAVADELRELRAILIGYALPKRDLVHVKGPVF